MRPIRVLLTPGFADWEVGLILGATQFVKGLAVSLHSPDGGGVTSLGGMPVGPLPPFAPGADEVAVICGGTIWETGAAPDLRGWLAAHRREGGTVAAICGAVLPLARGGYLQAIPHSSNGRDWLAHWAPGYAGADAHVDQPQALAAQGVITAPGSAPVSFAVEVLRAAGADGATLAQLAGLFAAEHCSTVGGLA